MSRRRFLLVGLGVVLIVVGVGLVFVQPELHAADRGKDGIVRVTIGCFTPWQQWTGAHSRLLDGEAQGIDSASASGKAYVPLNPGECKAATARHEHCAEGLGVAGLLVIALTLLLWRSPNHLADAGLPDGDN